MVKIKENLLGPFSPKSFRDCFYMDKNDFNPIPKGLLRKIYILSVSGRYSRSVYMRLAQYFYLKKVNSNKIAGIFYMIISDYYSRKNQVFNNFEVSQAASYIEGGVIFSIQEFVLPVIQYWKKVCMCIEM